MRRTSPRSEVASTAAAVAPTSIQGNAVAILIGKKLHPSTAESSRGAGEERFEALHHRHQRPPSLRELIRNDRGSDDSRPTSPVQP